MGAKTALLLLFSAALSLDQDQTGHANELAFGLGGTPPMTEGANPGSTQAPELHFKLNYGRHFVSGSTKHKSGD